MVQLQLLDLMISRECGAVPKDAATRAELIDLMACAIAAVFHEEGSRGNDRALAQSKNQTGASGSQGDRLPRGVSGTLQLILHECPFAGTFRTWHDVGQPLPTKLDRTTSPFVPCRIITVDRPIARSAVTRV